MRSSVVPFTFPTFALLVTAALIFSGCAHDARTTVSVKEAARVETRIARAPDGLPIAYDIRGEGEPALVFIHCWSCDRTFWREQTDAFAETHKVVTLDVGGHGDSGRARNQWTVASLAADVEAVIDAARLRRVILIGHSMGGPVALATAARMPRRVEAVVAVDTLHDAEMVWPEEARTRIVSAFENDFDEAIEQFVAMLVRHRSDTLVPWITERGKMVDREAAIALMHDFGDLDLPALFSAAGVPIRAINAAPLPPVQPPTAIETNRKYADFDAVLIDDVGHYTQLERPDEFNARLREVLSELIGEQ
jgi:pimeloyl-ACP methyl ester carboxylesterase